MSGRRTSPRRAFTPSFEAPGGCECYPAGGQVAMLPLGSSEVNLLAGGGMVSFVFARAIRTGAGSTPPQGRNLDLRQREGSACTDCTRNSHPVHSFAPS